MRLPAFSKRDIDTFQTALQLYEKKDFKGSLKHTEQLLKKSKNHGEALCLKGLLLYHLKHPEDEVAACFKEGLEIVPQSPISWHMAGIWHKLSTHYAESYDAYLHSFRLNQDNPSVQQDLSMLAAHQREFGVLVEVRKAMLASRPSVRMVWVGLAIAQYLLGNYGDAERTIELWNNFHKSIPLGNQSKQTPQQIVADKIDASELLLLKNKAIAASGNLNRAIEELKADEPQILDKLTVSERLASYYSATDKMQAISAWQKLIERNPDCQRYYEEFEKVLPETVQLKKAYKLLEAKYPRAEPPKLRPMQWLEGDELSSHISSFIDEKLARDVPSTFMFVKFLYKTNPEVMDTVVSQRNWNIGALSDRLFLAKHWSYRDNHSKALELVNEIPGAESNPDIALVKAKVYSRAGDYVGAFKILSEASKADIGDRSVNTKAAKYALRAGKIEEGIELACFFPKSGGHLKDKDGISHLIEMESVDMLTYLATAYARARDHGMALKRAMDVINIFASYTRDQYDFHYYGPRRGTALAYLELLSWEDRIYGHPRYFEVAKIAINEYLAAALELDDGLSDAERKQAKKQRYKRAQALATNPTAGEGTEPDNDPFGLELLATKTPLDEAFKLWKPLEKSRANDPATWKLGFDIYLAQHKYVVALQTLKRAREHGASEDWIAGAGIRLLKTVNEDTKTPEVIRSLQLKVLPTIVPNVSTDSMFVDSQITDLVEWVRVRSTLGILDDNSEKRLVHDIDSMNVKQCEEIVHLLHRARRGSIFASAVKSKWPQSTFV